LLLINHNSKHKYVPLDNPTNKIKSCFNTYPYDNEDLTKLLCDNNDACKGYYILSEPREDYSTFLPFSSSPVSNPSADYCLYGEVNPIYSKYTTYKSKVDNYTTPHNNPINGICYINISPRFIQKGVSGEDTIQKMCDKVPDCNGYYKHNTKPYYVASTSQKLPDDFDSRDCDDSDDDEDLTSSNFSVFMSK